VGFLGDQSEAVLGGFSLNGLKRTRGAGCVTVLFLHLALSQPYL